MWSPAFIALLCVLVPSVYSQKFLQPPYCGSSNITLRRIVGGVPAKLGEWPWITAIGYGSSSNPQFLCGGTLISDRHVVTAAHCILSGLSMVRIAPLNLYSKTDGADVLDVRVIKISQHPAYNARTIENDIAVLTLESSVPFTSKRSPICIPSDATNKNRNTDGLYGLVGGFGTTSSGGSSSSRLLHTQVPVTTEARCRQSYGSTINYRNLCAGYEQGGKDSCQGDSGGPFMLPSVQNQKIFYLYGVVSYGNGCAKPGYPGVYTRVTSFLSFIEQSMK